MSMETMAYNLIRNGYTAVRAARVLIDATNLPLRSILPAIRDAKLALGHTWCGEHARPMSHA